MRVAARLQSETRAGRQAPRPYQSMSKRPMGFFTPLSLKILFNVESYTHTDVPRRLHRRHFEPIVRPLPPMNFERAEILK